MTIGQIGSSTALRYEEDECSRLSILPPQRRLRSGMSYQQEHMEGAMAADNQADGLTFAG